MRYGQKRRLLGARRRQWPSLGKERNDAAGAFGHNPKGTGISGRMAALRLAYVE
jgi:hypothetical protein